MTLGRISSAIFKQNLSGQDLLAKFTAIEVCANKLATQANIDSFRRQKLLLNSATDMTKMIVSSTRRQDRGFNTVILNQQGLSEAVYSQDKSIKLVQQTLNQCLSFLMASPAPAFASKPCMDYLETANTVEGDGNPRSLSPSSDIALTRERDRRQLASFLDQISLDPKGDVSLEDVSGQLGLIYALSLTSQDRAVALLTSPRLQTWVTSTFSCALLINGQMFSSEHETRRSPLSYFCAKFVDSILTRPPPDQSENNNPVFVVRWFCGQHTDVREDFDAHPAGMVSNMLSQLVHQVRVKLPQVTLKNLTLPGGDLQFLDICHLFVQLAKALPTGTILFCIIDGISYYEDYDRRDECMKVLSMLTDLTRDIVDGPLIKLLVTAPLRAHHVQNLFEAGEVTDMDQHYPPNGGFHALQWDLGVGSVIG